MHKAALSPPLRVTVRRRLGHQCPYQKQKQLRCNGSPLPNPKPLRGSMQGAERPFFYEKQKQKRSLLLGSGQGGCFPYPPRFVLLACEPWHLWPALQGALRLNPCSAGQSRRTGSRERHDATGRGNRISGVSGSVKAFILKLPEG